MTDLINVVIDAVRQGLIPRPMPGEDVNDYAFRAAHAGALLGMTWVQHVQAQAAAEAAAAADDDSHSDATVASPDVPGSRE
jgi:hypothetical protein